MAQIQFKRILSSFEDLGKTIELLNESLNPSLQNGEPLICSYKETINGETKIKFLLAIGTPEGVHIIPAFKNQQDINEFIASKSAGNWIDEISDDSEIKVTRDENGKLFFSTKGWEEIKDE